MGISGVRCKRNFNNLTVKHKQVPKATWHIRCAIRLNCSKLRCTAMALPTCYSSNLKEETNEILPFGHCTPMEYA